MKRAVIAADLFCGAGGTSTGLLQAAQELGLNVKLIAINHWEMAIATHSANHPNVRHYNSDLSEIDPRKVVPGGKLRLLVASPECTHFSRARGGKPMSKQSRASVKYILRWISVLDVEDVLIENVPEFQDWGPLHRKGAKAGLPIANRKGEYFHRFIRKMEEHGYAVKWRVLNAADYGDPTTRKRLFIRASKSGLPAFPAASHHPQAEDLFGHNDTWRPAREIIDWSIRGESIFNRKRPLSPNTLRRIAAGLQKFGGQAFVVTTNWAETNRSQPRSIDDPIPAITGQGQIGIVQPFIIGQQSNAAPRSTDQPLPTVAGAGAISLVQPFIVPFHNEREGQAPRTHSVDEPLPTVTTEPRFGLAQPFIVALEHSSAHGKQVRSVDEPLQTVTGRGQFGVVEPFLMPVNHGDDRRVHSLDKPMPTITSVDAWAIVQPFVVMLNGTDEEHLKRSNRSVEEPLPTLTGAPHVGLVDPFLVEYHGTGGAQSIHSPLKTQTGKDRFGLVQPMIVKDAQGRQFMLDILFRMLRPHELAAAMSFPRSYCFAGNREQIVKQIGNAVPVNLAKALCKTALETRLRKLEKAQKNEIASLRSQ